MSELTRKEKTKSLELARYCVAGISTLAKQGCIVAALVDAKEDERRRLRDLVEARWQYWIAAARDADGTRMRDDYQEIADELDTILTAFGDHEKGSSSVMPETHNCSTQASRLLKRMFLNDVETWTMVVSDSSGYVNITAVSHCPWCGEQLGTKVEQGDYCRRSYGAWEAPLIASTCLRRYGHSGHCSPMGVMPGVSHQTYLEQAAALDAESDTQQERLGEA